MSQENVKIVRRFYEDGLLDRYLDQLLELATPDIEYVNPADAIESGTRRGRVAVTRAMKSFAEVWQASRHELHELFDCGDVVVASVSWYTVARGSRRELVQNEAHSWTLRDGRIARFEWGRDLGRALEAAGVSEQTLTPTPEPRDAARAMSQANVKIVRRASAALTQALASGDLTAVLRDFIDRDIDWRAVEGAVDDVGGMRGHDAIRRYIEDWTDLFDDLTLAPQEFVEVDDERVMAVQRLSGRAKHTGIETQLTFFVIYTVRAGRFVKVREYATREEALEAVGLSAESAPAGS